jgi:hypothetical protein
MKIAYVEHPHHQKTNSTHFFIQELINRGNEVNRIPRDSFNLETANDHEICVLFQADACIPIAVESGKKTMVVPMLDETLFQASARFRGSKNLFYLSFSKVLHDFLKASGCESRYVQYWPLPNLPFQKNSRKEKLTVFFWERTPEHVRAYDVMNWFRKYEARFVIRPHWDPNHSQAMKEKFSLSSSVEYQDNTWFAQEDYLKALETADVFVAPRRWEGIGLSTLEALARGIPIVGLDNPTLNEYIKNDSNGILIKDKFKPLDIKDFKKMSNKIIESAPGHRKHFEFEFQNALDHFFHHEVFEQTCFPVIPRRLTLREYVYLRQNK